MICENIFIKLKVFLFEDFILGINIKNITNLGDISESSMADLEEDLWTTWGKDIQEKQFIDMLYYIRIHCILDILLKIEFHLILYDKSTFVEIWTLPLHCWIKASLKLECKM